MACLCAQWCVACNLWQANFRALAQRIPRARMLWVDVEDAHAVLGDYEVENFPTLIVQRGPWLLHGGPLPPQIGVWMRLVEEFVRLSADEAAAVAAKLAQTQPELPDLRAFAE
ncbi:thioredoxin family protein [Thiomonas delicata]|uniref:thioredoxin family protein n=1 Tax=Thiomonas delicata TaxID=364030 RepID=UPI001FE87D8D|nr:thioredoxin family protein [Thiomonas delicata]